MEGSGEFEDNEYGEKSITEEELLDSIDFDSLENQAVVTPVKEGNITIEVGMEFPSTELIYELYNSYAFTKEFGLRKRNARPNYILFTCNRNGFNPDCKDLRTRKSSISRSGCQAALHAYKQNNSDMWRITKFTDVHNHEMVSPTSVSLLRSHKNYSAAAKSLTESFSRAGVPIAKVPTVFSSSIVPFQARDYYNHLNKLRKVIYEAGDAQGVQAYCNQQQSRDPHFFYSIQFNSMMTLECETFFGLIRVLEMPISYRKEGFDSRHKQRRLTLDMALEEHAASFYTRNVFIKFHEELSAILKFSKEKLNKVGQQSSYRVWNKKDLFDDHVVTFDIGELAASCTCDEFEFMGILCRHILTIFHAKNIEKIPSHYILQRWRKNGNKIVNSSGRLLTESSYCLRSFGLRPKYDELDSLADRSDVAYKFIYDAIDSVIATARDIVNNESGCNEEIETQVGSNPSHDEFSVRLKDPMPSQTKGRKRIKTGIEISKKNTNICSNCGNRGHNKRGCKLPLDNHS